jgi:hypothetical protein
MNDPGTSLNLDTMTPDEFQARLPELFAVGSGRISEDPRFARFLAKNPTCEALVLDLEYIADAARQLLDPIEEPSDSVWNNIQSKLKIAAAGEEPI